ncbi:MAG TPA: PAS domain-containing protein [Holophaga sp.]|nr:PAS domain-containing protein [Holophaga sp.]
MAISDFTPKPALPAETLRDALQLMPGPVLVVDREGIVTLCNDAASSLFRYPAPSFLMGRELHQAVHRRTREGGLVDACECPLHRSIQGRERILPVACTFWTADGAPIPVEVEGVPLPDGDHLLLSLADLASRRRQVEDLSARAQARHHALKGTIQGLTHEMNTPVQFLGINLGFLRHAFGRFERFMGTAQAFAADAPEASQAELRRLEEEMDLEFLRGEVPKVLAECVEGLGKMAQIANALGDLPEEAGEPRQGAWEGAANAS